MTEIQKVPALESGERPETGVMQFGDDWPGIFIRGDNAMYFAMQLRLRKQNPEYPHLVDLDAIADLLSSCKI